MIGILHRYFEDWYGTFSIYKVKVKGGYSISRRISNISSIWILIIIYIYNIPWILGFIPCNVMVRENRYLLILISFGTFIFALWYPMTLIIVTAYNIRRKNRLSLKSMLQYLFLLLIGICVLKFSIPASFN